MQTIHSFHASLDGGHSGEARLAAAYPDRLEQLDGRGADLRLKSNGETVEVKTLIGYKLGDEINHRVTPYITDHFCVERFSCRELRTDGGPWASARKGVDYYSYLWPHDGVWMVYRTTEFLRQTEAYLGEHGVRQITARNARCDGVNTYTTVGYLVPINWYEPILVRRFQLP